MLKQVFWFAVLNACLFQSSVVGASRTPIRAKHGMVVSAESVATAAGLEVLKQGGNAIDAAVAVGFTLAVTYPEAGNIGGGGFMIIRLANGRSTMIDFREKAPSAARRDMYLDSVGIPIPDGSLLGPLSAAVPGTVGGFLYSLEKYGTMPRKQVMARSIDIAKRGFPVSLRQAASFDTNLVDFNRFPSTRRVFTRNGVSIKEGDIFRQRTWRRHSLRYEIRARWDSMGDGLLNRSSLRYNVGAESFRCRILLSIQQ